MSGKNILSLLGLALRGGRLAVGEEPAALAAKAGQARLLLAASDAAGNTLRRMEHLAQEGHCLWLILPFSKAELGGALGRGSAAIAALTDTGLAAAVTERLALLDPERYGAAAERMDLKRRRAKERASAPRRDPPEKAQKARPPRDGQRPEARRDGRGRRDRPRDGEWKRRHFEGEGRPQGKGRLQGGRSRSGTPGPRGPAGSSSPGKQRGRPNGHRPPWNKNGPGPRRGRGR